MLFPPAPSSLPNPTAAAGEVSVNGSLQVHAQPGFSVSPSALKAAQRAKQSQGESFESREVAYKRLLELAEDGDIDRLLNGFIEKEEKNFACFSYATELNNEMEKMQQKIKNLQVCSRLFTSPLSQLGCFWAGVGFSSPVCSASLPTSEPSSQPATGVGLGEHKNITAIEKCCVLRTKSVSMLPPCTQQKYCSIQEGQELPLLSVGLPGAKSAVGSSPTLLAWGQWSPERSSGLSLLPGWRDGPPASVRHVWWAFSQQPLHVLVFKQDEITSLMTDQEYAESSSLHVVRELEVWRLGFPSPRAADPWLSRHVS